MPYRNRDTWHALLYGAAVSKLPTPLTTPTETTTDLLAEETVTPT
jgi:hypothetical protein